MSNEQETSKANRMKPWWTILMQGVITINTAIVIPFAVYVFSKINDHDIRLTEMKAQVEQVRIEADRDRLRLMAEIAAASASMRAELVARIEVINNNVLRIQTRLEMNAEGISARK